MGLPNSESQQKTLFRLQLRGTQPSLEELESRGLGSIFLEEKFAKFKPYVEYMSGQKNMEDLWAYAYEIETWTQLVQERGVTGVKALRLFLEFDDGHQAPLLTLNSLGRGAWTRRVEVFVTRKGEWIVFFENGSTRRLTFHASVKSLGRRLQSVARESNAYYNTDSPLITIGLHLDEVVRKTLVERAKATRALDELLAGLGRQNGAIGH